MRQPPTGPGTREGSTMWNFLRWNFAPNARNDSYSTNEDGVLHIGSAASVLKNDTDLNRDPLAIVEVNGAAAVGSAVTLPSGATLKLNADGTFDYDPNGQFDYLGAGQTATDSFSYRVADGHGGFDTATVSIKINGVGPVDKKPVALLDLDKATAGEGDTHGNVITGQDPDGAANKLLLLADNQGDGPAIIRSITHDGVTYTLSADETAVTVSGTPAGAWSYDDTTGDLTITTDLGGTLKIDLDGSSPGDYTYTPPASIGSGWWQSLPPFLRDLFNFKTETFTYKIEDTDGDTSSSLLTITVKEGSAPANQAPSGADATITTLEDTPHTFTTGEFGFSDPDGNALQAVLITSLPAAGALTLDGADVAAGQSVSAADIAAGLLVFTPAENANGTGYASLAFQVQDDGGTAGGGVDLDQTPNTITIDVTPVNDAPESSFGANSLFEDTPRVFGLADFPVFDDADSPPNSLLAVKITTLPDHGALTLDGVAVAAGQFISADDIAAGLLVFTPEENSTASTSFTFQVQDDGGTANGGVDLDPTPNQISFQFIPVNDPPVAVDDTAETDEDIPVNIDVLANDTDSDSPTLYVTEATAAHGTVVIETDGTITYTPDANFNGTDTINYTVADGDIMVVGTETDTAKVTVTVNPVNDPPEAASLSLGTIATGGSRIITTDEILRHVTDIDSATVTLESLAIQSGNGTLQDLGDGSWLYTGVAGDTSNVVFAYTVSDGSAESTGEALLNLNSPITASEIDLGSGPEDTPKTFTFGNFLAGAHDDDGPSLGVTSVSVDPAFGVVQHTGATWTFTPAQDYFGPVTFTYTVSDGFSTATSTATFTVTPVNDAPIVFQGIADQSVDEDTAWSFAVPAAAFADVDGDALSLTASLADGSALPAWLSFDGTTFTGTPPQDFNGDIGLKVTASDGSDSVETSFTLTVNPVNDAPVVDQGIGDQSVDEDTLWSFAVPAAAFADVEGDALTLTATLADGSALPTWLSFDGTSFTGTPPQDFNGDIGLKVIASDGSDSAETSFTLTITPVNDAPVIADQAFSVAEESLAGTAVGAVLATDVDSPSLTYAITAGNDLGLFAIDAATGAITLAQPVDDPAVGSYALTVTVDDGTNSPQAATVTIEVTPVNDAPVAAPVDLGAIDEDGSRTITSAELLAGVSDVDGPAATITALSIQSGNGALVDNGNDTWTYTPAANDDTDVTFAYTASDGELSASSTASLDLTPVNDAPVAADGSASTPEDTLLSGLLPAATDADGDAITYAAGSVAPQHGSLNIQPDGSYDYAPEDNFNGTDSFSYTVSDGNGGVNEYTFDVTVTPVNDAPLGTSETVTIDEDTAYVFSAADFGFADPLDDPANSFQAVIIGSAPGAGTLTLDGVALTDGAVVSVADIDDGKLAFTPAPDANGDGYDAFTFQVQDDGGTDNGGSDTSQLRAIHFNVTPQPDDPVAADDTGTGFTTDEETAFTTASVLTNDSDPDGDPVTFTGFDATGAIGVFTYNGDGTFDYDPNGQFDALGAGETATDTITYTVSDGTGREDTATLTVTIDGINDAPRTIDDSFGANSDYDAFVVGTGEVYLGVNDGNGTFVTSPLVQDSLTRDGAAFGDLNGDGNLDVFVAGDGPERVWINDGQGNLTQVTNVTTANDSNNYDVELGDINGDGTLDAVVASNGSTANRIWLNDGSGTNFTAGASLNYAGKTTTYDVAVADIDKDGDLDIIEANAGVNRIWLNQGGGVFSTANVIDFGSAAENSRDVAVADLNNDGYLDIFIANEDSGNTVWLNNGDSQNPGFTQVPGSLGNGESRAVALGDLNGDGTIDAFVVNSGTAGGDPDNNGAANEVWFNDGDGNFTLSTNNGVPLGNYASLDVELADVDGDGDLDALVANNVDGQPNLIWYNDGHGNFTSDGTAIGDFAARDVALGDIDGDAALAADQVQVLDVLANDADPDANDTLTIISIDPGDLDGALTIAPDGKSIEFDPSGSATLQALVRDSLGTYDFTYTVSDGHGGTDTASVEITVRGVNEPPSLAVTTLADDSYDGGTLAEELADGGGLSLREAIGLINDGTVSETRITFDDSIAGGQIDLSGDLAITASMDIDGGTAGMTVAGNGSDRVFTIDGGATTSISVSLDTLTITGGGSVNRGGGVRVLAGDHVSITNSLLVGNDANNFGDAIAVEIGASATLTNTTVADNGVGTSYAVQSEGTITMSNVTVTGNAHGVGISGGTATTVNSIVLGNGGTADFVVSGFTTYAFNGLSIIGEGTDTDPSDGKIDGDPVQVFAGSDPSGAGILADNGGPTLTVALRNDPSNPALDAAIGGTDTDQRGVAAFDAVAGTGDSGNNRDIGAYELSANAPHAPVAADDAFTGPEDTEITGNVLADNGAGADSDADNDVLSVIAGTFATAQGGSVTLNADGSFSYLPVANFNGTDSFDYRVTDGTLSDTGTVTLTVTPVPDAPVAIDDAFTGRQDTQISGNVLADNGAGADYDPDGEAPTAVEMSVANLGGGGITINEDGSFIYAPAAGFTGTESFTYQIRDLGGLTDTGRITFTVVPNAAPVATADGYSLDEDTTLAIAAPGVLANDSDANGDALSAILVNDVTHGTLTLNGDGSFSYMPDANYNGADSFTYKTNDGLVDSNTVTVDLTVNPVADPAQIVGDFSGAVTEDGTLVANGSVSISDVDGDLSSTDFVPGIFVDPDGYGQFRVFTNGDWQFTLDNSSPLVQQLGVDPLFGTADTITRSYTVESLDGGLSETVDITISGANDVATITGDSAGTVYAAGYAEGPINDAPIISGKLDISDADAGQDILSTGLLAQSTLGTFDYDADGNWTFDLNENYPGLIDLGAGDTLTATYTLTSLDGTASQDVTITIERLVLIHLDPNLATVADPGTTDPITNPTQPPATPIEGGLIGATVVTTDTSSASTTTTSPAPGELFTYHLGDGPITIADFDQATAGQTGDHIVLSGFDLDFNALDTSGDGQIDTADASVTGDATGLTLDFGNGDSLTVEHVSALHHDDLLFS
jgi:VCBS repeat-containing protein